MKLTERQRYIRRWEALKRERSSWIDHWRELSEHINPRRSRFLSSDVNKGAKRNDTIINNTPLRSARILAAGMMAGVTSPSRKWFKLTTRDPNSSHSAAGRSWLHLAENRMFEAFARSNVYAALTLVYLDLAVPGTTALYVEEDGQDVIRCYVFALGQYCLAASARLSINAVYREVSMTVEQLVEKFGLDAVSPQVRDQYERGELDEWRRVLHVIEPRRERDPHRLDAGNMPYASAWMELDYAGDERVKMLARGGYEEFPCMCPRWASTGEDVYGSDSPGMQVLGDAKALQTYELEAAKAVAKFTSPPMVGPSSLRNARVSLVPGDVTYVDDLAAGKKLEPAYVPDARGIEVLEAKLRQHERRIEAGFFVDLFLSLLNEERANITAEEIRAKQQEKMLQLGPVIERLNDELLDPLIDRCFGIMLRTGLIPPPPPELEGENLKVEYISVLAQAQKLLGTTAVERLIALVKNLLQLVPDISDKIDWDQLIDDYAEMLGVPPDELRSAEAVQQIRAAKAKQLQTQQQGEALLSATQGARNLSGASLGDDNALSRLLGAMGPAAAAAAPPGGVP